MRASWRFFILISGALMFAPSGSALTVISPASDSSVLTRAGDDFATGNLANPWDMSDAEDIPLSHLGQLSNAGFDAGIFHADSTGGDPNFYVLWPGFTSVVPMAEGALNPISTDRYRYFTMKIRLTAASGPPLTSSQPVFLYYMMDPPPSSQLGVTKSFHVQPGVWQIVEFDMLTDTLSAFNWTSSASIRGLRIDPTNNPGVHVEVDWIHLSAPATTPGENFLVTWTDTMPGPYSVTAIDGDGASLLLGDDILGTQFLADFSRLPPGEYSIQVARDGASAVSAGTVRINNPPILATMTPDVGGDRVNGFAITASGNAWGPMDAADISSTNQLIDISFTNPLGSLTARPTGSDSGMYFNTHGQFIDAETYRSLCFRMQVHGTGSVGSGRVARVFWGNPPDLFTSQDIVLDPGLNEYCIPDMALVPIEPDASSGHWNGVLTTIRLDPHEYSVSTACVNNPSPDNCRDVRLDGFHLSPYYRADPDFTFQWNLIDADHATVNMAILLDPDTSINGNEIPVESFVAGTGLGERYWVAQTGLPVGLYNVVFTTNDGVNQWTSYAGGPLNVISTAASDTIFANGFE